MGADCSAADWIPNGLRSIRLVKGYGIRSISPSTNDIFGNAESENEPTRLQLQCQVLVMN